MAKYCGLNQVEAMGENVRSQKGVHGVQLNEDVGQKHNLIRNKVGNKI